MKRATAGLLCRKRFFPMDGYPNSRLEPSAHRLANEPGSSTPGMKRPFSQTPVPAGPSSAKFARFDTRTGGFQQAKRFAENRTTKEPFGYGHPGRVSKSRPSTPPMKQGQASKRRNKPFKHTLPAPLHDEAYIMAHYHNPQYPLTETHKSIPKSTVANFSSAVVGKLPQYDSQEGWVTLDSPVSIWRTTVTVPLEPPVVGVGDAQDKKESARLAALSALCQMQRQGLHVDNPKLNRPAPTIVTEAKMGDGTVIDHERARSFIDWYCRQFKFPNPDIVCQQKSAVKGNGGWEAVMSINASNIGLGKAPSMKGAKVHCYLDAAEYLQRCDPQLWADYRKAVETGTDLGLASKVRLDASDFLDDMIYDLNTDLRQSALYRNRPTFNVAPAILSNRSYNPGGGLRPTANKSKILKAQLEQYERDPRVEQIRSTRMSLPVYTRSDEILKTINDNSITICIAETGSGKTTQIPQIIFDDHIKRGVGAKCNVLCTQPRRIAAMSVADRVAKERGEPLGATIGYQVRFERKLPEPGGSITFCTIGILLKRLQSSLSSESGCAGALDDVTHIVVDEVHERDVDTDLLLVVLKRLMADRVAKKKPLKIVLMSATIDPSLFQNYFKETNGKPCGIIDIPGRTFPVERRFMDTYLPQLFSGQTSWLLRDESVGRYIFKELGPAVSAGLGIRLARPPSENEEDLEMPYPLVAATIAHALKSSDDGHVLVFLPGWDEILATQKALELPLGPLPIDVNDKSKFSIHVLHSTIPLKEQQVIFEPPPRGVRRIILSTNIAETSVTIPDIVYVVDTGKVKEVQYDATRHLSSLVSAWVGKSNLNQRAGRAGRHRPGTYYGVLSKQRSESLHPYQTVEMMRTDLSNVVMHIKALDFPGMTVEEVLRETIEPPEPERVAAAMESLAMVGALENENLTPLGRVLLSLPVEVQMGRLVLYGSFFRCLDQALTLAAIMTNRDPFVTPMHLKTQAATVKNSWAPNGFRSDVLATLRAYNEWWALQSSGHFVSANRFCVDNFLAKPTLLLISKVKDQLLQSLHQAGVLAVSAGGEARVPLNPLRVPPELNTNGNCWPLLAGLIAIASQPKFAIRSGERTLRTAKDKITVMHPSSVNNRRKNLLPVSGVPPDERQIYAFNEKRRNASSGGGSSQTSLVSTTRLDPLIYLLFGAYNSEAVERGLVCDNWLPIVGNVDVLDNIKMLKHYMEGSFLRVFEGILMSRQRIRHDIAVRSHREESEVDDDEPPRRSTSLSMEEIKDLDIMTNSIVQILNKFTAERMADRSPEKSQPSTPDASPRGFASRLPGGSRSGYSTPNYGFSRPGTPSMLARGR